MARRIFRKKAQIQVKKKFRHAMLKMRRMSRQQQRKIVTGSSTEFIKDMSKFLSKLRTKAYLVKSSKHRRQLKRHKHKLRHLVNPSIPIEKKRKILLMKGGIAPFLIPIICASITAAGGVGAAATSAAIMKS